MPGKLLVLANYLVSKDYTYTQWYLFTNENTGTTKQDHEILWKENYENV